MGVIWTNYNSRDEWLAHRDGLGASDAGAACGMGFKTALQLWKEKTGAAQAEDLSDNERVQFGNAIEEPMRGLFRVMHPEYNLEFVPYTILRRDDHHQFAFCTPDGWLTEIATGRRGLWECKSATCLSAGDWARWRDKVPPGYFCQILHGMAVGDFEFAVIFAILRNKDGDAEIRSYRFERADFEPDIKWLLHTESKFWGRVQSDTMPPTPLTL